MQGWDGGTRTGAAPGAIGFADSLHAHGASVAVVDEHGVTWSYADLAVKADEVAARLGEQRRLVLIESDGGIETIAGLLGAYRGGHVALLTGAERERNAGIVATYDPDVVLGGGQLVERRPATAHELHPDLRLLLSTSGSTGSPKLVRLSGDAIDANARAIAGYLSLRPSDRAITSLPLQYCYGLSVLHSHLAVGASIVCTPASVVDPCFWTAVDDHGVTNLAGVPHTFELLDRGGFADRSHPSLRLLTQAGGRMAPDTVRRWAQVGQRRGFDLYVMYGQTEATARMAYLPPDLVEANPDAVGLPVPGGSFRIEPLDGLPTDEGELVYAGPNVMLGYAERPADLALGRTVDELRTGDIARIGDDGLVRIVGRRQEILKVFGLRIDLRRVQAHLDAGGIDATCAGDDDGLTVAVHDDTPDADVRAAVSDVVALPAAAVAVAAVPELPLLPNGKVDRGALVDAVRDAATTRRPAPTGAGVRDLLATLLGTDPGPDDTFVSLGGDSLTYVEASIALEERLGLLPDHWHLRTMAELDDLEPASPRTRGWARVETGVLLRAVAIVLVVGTHAGTFRISGGAHLLFAAAGFNMARFQLRSGAWGRSLGRLVVPAMVWIGGVAALTDDFDAAHALLLHGWVGGRGRWAYWFVEVLAQVLLAVIVLLRVPVVRRLQQHHPFALACALLVPTLAVRFDVIDTPGHHYPFFRPHEIAWIFVLGWAAAAVRTPWHRLIVTAVALAAVPGFFGNTTRDVVLLAGLLLLLWVPSLPVPRRAPRLIGLVAGASLHIYLSHVQVHPLVSDRWPFLGVLASLAFGIALWHVTQPVQQRTERACTTVSDRFAPFARRSAGFSANSLIRR
ncbi:MAG TPA: AMP-binding protein [Acidimicrobiales bacterium]|nr:AMP-binding protein [Acidimicrobiales bacterium]